MDPDRVVQCRSSPIEDSDIITEAIWIFMKEVEKGNVSEALATLKRGAEEHNVLQDVMATLELLIAVYGGDEVGVMSSVTLGGLPTVTFPISGLSFCLVGMAAWMGHFHLLPCLLDVGLSLEGRGNHDIRPLMIASVQGHSEMIQTLLLLGADPLATDKEGRTALHYAAAYGFQDCVAWLASVTPPVPASIKTQSPVHLASHFGHFNVVQQLAEAGWPLNIIDSLGVTPLHYAAMRGNVEMARYLVQQGLNPCRRDQSGRNSMDWAVTFGRHTMEQWLAKNGGATDMDETHCIWLMRFRRAFDEVAHTQIVSFMSSGNSVYLGVIPKDFDGHVQDEAGLTPLHVAAKVGLPSETVKALLERGVNPHVVTADNMTPIDLARMQSHRSIVDALQRHHCGQEDSDLEALHEELLLTISRGDDVRTVSRYLCRGTPVELLGSRYLSALQLAVTTDRNRTVSLLLACGAPLSAGLLLEAWQSPDVTSGVLSILTAGYCCRLRAERRRLEVHRILAEGIDTLLKVIEGDAPWKVAWRWSKETTHADLTELLAEATRANCPVTVAFLQRAGAWPFFSTDRRVSPLHAALDTRQWKMVEMLIRDFKACPYVSDASGRLPVDLMPQASQSQLEERLYKLEQKKLEDLQIREKTTSGKEKVDEMLHLQEVLFSSHLMGRPHSSVLPSVCRDALLLASRKGLTQVMYLLLKKNCLAVNEVLDNTSNTTALHQAASHGKDTCVALLLSFGADPLLTDKYGQTPRLLAAMFGHKSTFHLLAQYEESDPPCRAGTNAKQIKKNFNAYLRCYDKMCSKGQKSLTPFDHHYPERVTTKLLRAINPRELQEKAEDFRVDFSRTEARTVKEVVMTELNTIMDRVATTDATYRGELKIVGSVGDGSKLYAPDEFDVNLIISPEDVDVTLEEEEEEKEEEENTMKTKCNVDLGILPGTVEVTAHDEEDTKKIKSRKKKISVQSKHGRYTSNCLIDGLHKAMREDLTLHLFNDARLSLVPPGLTKTQVGVALALAWQGEQEHDTEDGENDGEGDEEQKEEEEDKASVRENRRNLRPETYPLLLVGVDLVPVLKVPWSDGIQKHNITPLDTRNMYISNTDDGSWRCSFAQAEAEVLRRMDSFESLVQVMGKLLLSHLKAESWMPRHKKTFCTWFVMRAWNIPLPSGFCLKNAVLRWLDVKEKIKRDGREGGCEMWQENVEDPVKVLMHLFRSMCDVPTDEPSKLHARNTPAFFGGECEREKQGYGAPIIVQCLDEFLKKEESKRERNMKDKADGIGEERKSEEQKE